MTLNKAMSWHKRLMTGIDWPQIMLELELHDESAKKIVWHSTARTFEREYLELWLGCEFADLVTQDAVRAIATALNKVSKRNYLVAVMVVGHGSRR